MLHRIARSFPVIAVTSVRFYTPSEHLKKLYASDFEKGNFPTDIVPSDSVLFAKFLYKAAEPENSFESIINDFRLIATAVSKLPALWERTCRVGDVKEFKSLSEPTFFTLEWMQNNGMLELLPEVAEVYETYVNAKLKHVIAKIYVAPGELEDKATVDKAKQIAEEIVKQNKDLSGYKIIFKVFVDRTIVEGFAVDVRGTFVNQAKGRKTETRIADESDYMTIPLPQLRKSYWEDNIETEVLRKYLDNLAQYDAEELRAGV